MGHVLGIYEHVITLKTKQKIQQNAPSNVVSVPATDKDYNERRDIIEFF